MITHLYRLWCLTCHNLTKPWKSSDKFWYLKPMKTYQKLIISCDKLPWPRQPLFSPFLGKKEKKKNKDWKREKNGKEKRNTNKKKEKNEKKKRTGKKNKEKDIDKRRKKNNDQKQRGKKKQIEHPWYLPELPALPQQDFQRNFLKLKCFFFLKKKKKAPEISAK